jgi:hypothetical protein
MSAPSCCRLSAGARYPGSNRTMVSDPGEAACIFTSMAVGDIDPNQCGRPLRY